VVINDPFVLTGRWIQFCQDYLAEKSSNTDLANMLQAMLAEQLLALRVEEREPDSPCLVNKVLFGMDGFYIFISDEAEKVDAEMRLQQVLRRCFPAAKLNFISENAVPV